MTADSSWATVGGRPWALATQVAQEIQAGRRVLVASASWARSGDMFRLVADLLPDATRIVRSSGREQIIHPSGGWARFGPWASLQWRGMTADTLALHLEPADDQLAGIMPCLAASEDPRVIRS